MSDRTKFFIFTEESSQIVLYIKKSVSFNYPLKIRGVQTYKVVTDLEMNTPRTLVQIYNPLEGFKKVRKKPGKKELQRLEVLRRKVEVTVLMVTNVNLVRKDIAANFSNRYIDAFPVSSSNFRKFWIFLQEEKKLLSSRVQKFMKEYYDRINSIDSIAEVDDFYEQLRLNLNLGVYSAMNRERKGINVKKG